MADSDNPRSHPAYDPQRPGGEGPRSGSGDPLAELARLIGQSDPFADYERNRAGAAAPQTGYPTPQHDHPQEHTLPPQPAHPDYDAASAQGYPAASQEQAPQPYPEQYQEAAQYPGQAYAYEYPSDPAAQQGYQPYYDPYYDAEGNVLDEAEYHEQQERQRRRRRLATVAVILALFVLGGAGAYGYRTLVATMTPASPPPVIKADTTPTKVIPAAQASDSASNKLIYDRVGDNSQAEKVVSREETPIDIKTASVAPPPRVVYSGPHSNPVAAPTAVATIPVTRQNTGGQVLPVASEPSIATQSNGALMASAKKVRTVTIRPDMTVVPNPAAADPAQRPRSTPPAQPAEAARPARNTPPSPASARPVAPQPPRPAAAEPLSLAPGDVAQPAPRPPAPARAAVPSSQPLQLAAVPPSAPNPTPPVAAKGTYVVQVSSRRSEADAKTSYRTLQARYPGVLGGHSSFVRRADLGTRGIYYRTMVGPFATSEQAGQFCGSLKSAGGQCIIHRN